MFGSKFKDYLGATYDVFQNKSLIPLFAKPISTEIAEKAAREFMKIAKANNKTISWQEALTAVDNVAESARPPTNFDKDVLIKLPYFFSKKSMADRALIMELPIGQRKIVEEILGKTRDPVQTILAQTGAISAFTRRNELINGLMQNSTNALKSYKNGLRPLLYESVEQIVKKTKELGETYDPSLFRAIKPYGKNMGISNPAVGRFALNEVADALETMSGKPYQGVLNNSLNRNLILLPRL